MKKILLAVALGAVAKFAFAVPVEPMNYIAPSNTGCDNRCYHDPLNQKLIDGVYGEGTQQTNSGSGWVGWRSSYSTFIDIDFFFSNHFEFTNISINSVTGYSQYLPVFSIFTRDGLGNWNLAAIQGDSARLGTTTSFSNDFAATDGVRIRGSGQDWLLIGEVDFQGILSSPAQVSSVPEPGTSALLLVGLGLFGGIARHHKQNAKGAKLSHPKPI